MASLLFVPSLDNPASETPAAQDVPTENSAETQPAGETETAEQIDGASPWHGRQAALS
jgi:hypothetical protein